MKNSKSCFTLLFCLIPFLLHAAPQRENTLREIYAAGTVRFVPELTLDESTMPEGIFIKTIGRLGQGPGEFNMPFAITVAKDRMIVWDMGNLRLCLYTTDGEFIKSVKVQRDEGRPQKMRLSILNKFCAISTKE